MLQIILNKIKDYYESGNRWWIPVLAGLLYSLALPPFSGLLHPLLAPFPLLAFGVLIPMFYFITRPGRRRALVHTYIYCSMIALSQYYWIGFVSAEGLWHLIIIGTILIALGMGLFFFVAALLFRITSRLLPRLYLLVFPALWVLVEYSRTLGEISFPWSFLGYSAAGILPVAQAASVTGVWGLSFLIVLGNVFLWELLLSLRKKENIQQKFIHYCVWAVLVLGIAGWGALRMRRDTAADGTNKVALLQSYMDQFHWTSASLDSAFTISQSMVVQAAQEKPDLMILPESALLCYLDKRASYRRKVMSWVRETKVPFIAGALHWENPSEGSPYDYYVYNTAFLVDSSRLTPYHKIMLVPFSEAMPFEARMPILSRVNLGEADFQRGAEESLFRVNDSLEVAPYICYEIIYPSFVQRRLRSSTSLLVNVTNDGWFGRSSGPFQHAAMAQMRSIENGISLARSANSGISMTVDPFGRILSRSKLYERATVVSRVPRLRLLTPYSRYGDWFVSLCALITAVGGIFYLFRKRRGGEITQPLLVKEQRLAAGTAARTGQAG